MGYWGWPWQGEHTEEAFAVTVLNTEPLTFCPWESNSWIFQFWINQPLIQKVQPISIFAQLFTVIAKAGGYLSIFCASMHVLYTLKYPPSEEELVSTTMTLRGCSSSHRPGTT